MRSTITESKRMDGKRKIIVVSLLITMIFYMSCAHSSAPDLLGYDIEYLAGYYYWKHNEVPAKIDDIILAYEELQQEWSHNPHATTYSYLREHQKQLFLFAYKDRCYYVDLYNIGYNVILLKDDSLQSNYLLN